MEFHSWVDVGKLRAEAIISLSAPSHSLSLCAQATISLSVCVRTCPKREVLQCLEGCDPWRQGEHVLLGGDGAGARLAVGVLRADGNHGGGVAAMR